MAKSRSSKPKLSKNTSKKFAPLFIFVIILIIAFGLVAALAKFNGDNKSQASVLAEGIAQFSITSAPSVANQDGNDVTVGSDKIWIGNGISTTDSYVGMHFSGSAVPANATIKSATLEVTAVGGWINTGVAFYGDTSDKGTFSQGDKLSSRSLTTAKSEITENVNWGENQVYTYDVTDPVKELVGSNGKSTITLIGKGIGTKYGRKEIFGTLATGKAPKLSIVYTAIVTVTPEPSPKPAESPAVTPSPSQMPSSMPGMSDMPTPAPSGTPVSSAPNGDSMEMDLWSNTGKNKPNPKYDKCDDGTDVVAAHKTFSVIGPDGKRYPTWHPPVVTNPITGVGKCYFGHEHGRDPKGYKFYDEVRKNFAYDANKNGTIEPDELAKAGIPFGYVNNAVDTYYAANPSSTSFMRHEDHVGHKIDYANGEGDIGTGTDPFDSSMTGGLVVPVKSSTSGKKWDPSGIRCYHFDKFHQGVSSPDALSNNMHEIIMHEKCISTRPGTPDSTSLLSGMMTLGAPGEFTQFCNDDRTKVFPVGLNADTKNLPGSRSDGHRNIITRGCIERTVLVPKDQFSSFPYEEWDGTLRVIKPNGTVVAANSGSWDVLDAIRYYNASSPNMISYMADVCYENFNGRAAHGGSCDQMTSYGTIKGITWDDPRSAYQGRSRGQYVNYHTINNAGGSEVWYTDPFGKNAQTTPFPGSIRQVVSKVNLPQIQNIDPRIIQRVHDSGKRTVHAPN